MAHFLRREVFAVFDRNGRPLTPPDGITFNRQLGLMQGIIAIAQR